MKHTMIYALDFDGVICDSAVETGMTGWKAAAQLWGDMDEAWPPQALIDRFRQVRPIIETGYEAILAIRMLHQGESVEAILSGFSDNKQALIDQAGTSIAALKKLFADIRDAWIHDALAEWITMNPLFPGIADKLRALSEQALWYIVTTKQERFVAHILKANEIDRPPDMIFGLDRNMSKEEVLSELQRKHPGQVLYFVEDRLPTLLHVMNSARLKRVKLAFASWGYNTIQDKREVQRHPIEFLGLENFLKPLPC